MTSWRPQKERPSIRLSADDPADFACACSGIIGGRVLCVAAPASWRMITRASSRRRAKQASRYAARRNSEAGCNGRPSAGHGNDRRHLCRTYARVACTTEAPAIRQRRAAALLIFASREALISTSCGWSIFAFSFTPRNKNGTTVSVREIAPSQVVQTHQILWHEAFH